MTPLAPRADYWRPCSTSLSTEDLRNALFLSINSLCVAKTDVPGEISYAQNVHVLPYSLTDVHLLSRNATNPRRHESDFFASAALDFRARL